MLHSDLHTIASKCFPDIFKTYFSDNPGKPNFQWGMLIGICVHSISTKDQGVAHTLSWLSRDASFKTASRSEPL